MSLSIRIRTISFVQDCQQLGGVFQPRWLPSYKSGFEHTSLMVSGDAMALTKCEDPRWRLSWRWALLSVPLDVDETYRVRVFWQSDSFFKGIWTVKRLATPYFALRVGPGDMMVSVETESGEWLAPAFVGDEVDSQIQLHFNGMQAYTAPFHDQVTYI